VQETQTVTLRHTPTGGSFTLGFGDVNIALPGTVTAKKGDAYVTTSVDLTATIARGDHIKIGGTTYLVHASLPFTSTQLPLASATNAAAATQLALGATPGAGEAYAGSDASGLTAYAAAVTNGIDYAATAQDVKNALGNLPSIGQVGVSRTCNTLRAGACTEGYVWTVTFIRKWVTSLCSSRTVAGLMHKALVSSALPSSAQSSPSSRSSSRAWLRLTTGRLSFQRLSHRTRYRR
jgi:hypothetical protein